MINIDIDFRTSVKRFYPYESVQLVDRILTFSGDEDIKYFKRKIESMMGKDLKAAYVKHVGFSESYCNLEWDNKVTFMLKTTSDNTYYMQFYDNQVIIGLSIMKRNHDPETHYIAIN